MSRFEFFFRKPMVAVRPRENEATTGPTLRVAVTFHGHEDSRTQAKTQKQAIPFMFVFRVEENLKLTIPPLLSRVERHLVSLNRTEPADIT